MSYKDANCEECKNFASYKWDRGGVGVEIKCRCLMFDEPPPCPIFKDFVYTEESFKCTQFKK